MAKRDYYEILGINKDASADEIKRAYRKLAVKHHPDKEGGDEEKFKEATEAYEVLKDSKKRQAYDQFGHAGTQGFGTGGAGAGYNPFGGGFGQGQQFEVDFGDLDLGDIFGSFFGGARGGQRAQTRSARGRDVETAITIDFKEAVFGTEKTVQLELEDVCNHCKGTTAEPGSKVETCKTCKGSGQVVQTQRTILGSIQHASVCPTCRGRGQVPEKPCSVCGGKGTKREKKRIKVKIPAGIDHGATMRLREKGEAVANGARGDLYVHVRVRPHPGFERHGAEIVSEETVDMVEAALGTEIKVNTVDGPISMKIPAGTQSGQTFKLSERGVPHISSRKRGDHIVKVTVKIPKKLNKRQQELLQQFAEESGNKRFWQK